MEGKILNDLPTVAILLSTHNGQQYLPEQLKSFLDQSFAGWSLWASDDASTDNTVEILQAFKSGQGAGKVSLRQGPGSGFVSNFLSMVNDNSVEADYFAYSDQDDIWEPEKLERAVRWLSSVDSSTPSLYCSRTRLVDADNNEIGLSPLFAIPPGFVHALTQNIGGGNTMVFNRAAREVLQIAGAELTVPTHDWWTYLAISAVGGTIFYDRWPSLRYRQHSANLIGGGEGWAARWKRLAAMWRGRSIQWHSANVAALRALEGRLPVHNREALENFVAARKAPLIRRISLLRRSGIYRSTPLQQCGLLLAAIFGRI